jgi:hypothetical protein
MEMTKLISPHHCMESEIMKNGKMKLLVTFAFVFLFGSVAQATYYRSCHGRVLAYLEEEGVTGPVVVDEFTATGSGGIYIPNTIRLRAYRKAVDCLENAIASSGEGVIPEQCTEANDINGFEIDSWRGHIQDAGCEDWGSRGFTGHLHVTLWGYVSGDNGCGGSYGDTSDYIKLAEWYGIYCPR